MIVVDKDAEKKCKQRLPAFWSRSGETLRLIAAQSSSGTPVLTVDGAYQPQGWTEWTQGFQFGSAILHFDATGDQELLEYGRSATREHMAGHVSHFGVHDHGFNNVSTYGNLLRLMKEGRVPGEPWEQAFYELALKLSGSVQAQRWSRTVDGGGYIYSFNGPHSLFADTIRSLRSLAVSHVLGHEFMGECDERISLLERLIEHARTTAMYTVYYGEDRDLYDVEGRVAHESVFNVNDGRYRCPSSQQGYSPFSTWTRGLAWVILGYAELLEFLREIEPSAGMDEASLNEVRGLWERAARATCRFYLAHTPSDGIPYWDTGAPGLEKLGDYLNRPAEPFNEHEPVDSSAAAIAAQGLLRFGRYLSRNGDAEGALFEKAGWTTAARLLDEPYLSGDAAHQGLILHSIYHRPNAWDVVHEGQRIPNGESSMWGDYHARELALTIQRYLNKEQEYCFYNVVMPEK